MAHHGPGFSRRDFLRSSALGAGALAACGALGTPLAFAQEPAKRRPNVVFIITDDQNFDTMSPFAQGVLTPNIQRLAREGVVFDRNYTTSAICTPSRYITLTGRYAGRCDGQAFLAAYPPGTQSQVMFNTHLTPGSPTLPQVLHDAGYVTGCVGKWHVGGAGYRKLAPDSNLRDPVVDKILKHNQELLCAFARSCGFDYAASMYQGNLADYRLNELVAHNMEWVVDGALRFIDQNRDKPFFLYMAPTLLHSPTPTRSLRLDPCMTPAGYLPEPPRCMPPRESIFERVKAAGLPENTAGATWLDDGIGAVIQRLSDYGILDDTAIFVFSDNGTAGGKGTCYEGGAHTPALLRFPGYVPAGIRSSELVGNIDFAPTILDLCGVRRPDNMHLDGANMLPMLNGGDRNWRREMFLEVGHTRAVCTAKWKYIALRYPPKLQEQIDNGTLGRPAWQMDTTFDLEQTASKAHPAYFDLDQLYDLENDPGERVNLAKDPAYGDVLADMKSRLTEWLRTFGRPFGEFCA